MRIQHNIAALNSYRNYSANTKAVSKNLEKLSSGYRINRAGDDAAGLAISEKMRAQVTGLETAQKNSKDGISLIQTAEGALTEVHSMLNRMVELADQSANGTYDDSTDRANLQKEISQLKSEIDRIADSTNFNGIKLLNGELGEKISDVLGKTAGAVDFSDGMDIKSTAGTGAKSEFSLSIDKEFSDGDTLTINYNIPTTGGGTTQKSLTLTYQDTPIVATDTDLTFSGATKEDQMNSIMERLAKGTSTDANFVADFKSKMKTDASATTADTFNMSVTGNTLTFTAGAEAKEKAMHISSVTSSNVNCTFAKTQDVAGTNHAAATVNAYKTGITKLVTGTGNIQAGDTLRFDFTLGSGKTSSVDLKITSEMINSNHEIMTQNIANALSEANFTDNDTTNMDESQFKVKDFFDVHANLKENVGNTTTGAAAEVGSIQFTAKDLTSATAVGDFRVTGVSRALSGSNTFNSMVGGDTALVTGNLVAGTPGTDKEKNTLTFAKNFGLGDQFKLQGTLEDGRTFEVILTATKNASEGSNTFKKGDTVGDSVTNIVAALNSNTTQVKITNRDGSDGGTMTGNNVFNSAANPVGTKAGAAGITLTANAGALEIENNQIGTSNILGRTGSIDWANTTVISAPAASASAVQIKGGLDQTNAKMTMDFNDVSKLEYGSAFTIGTGNNAKTFELVASADAATTQSGNIRVVVADLANASGNDVARAAKAAIDAELTSSSNPDEFSAWAGAIGVGTAGGSISGGSVGKLTDLAAGTSVISLETLAKGSNIGAISNKATYGVKQNTTINFNKDESGKLKLKAGDTVKINGQMYQFDNDIRNIKDGAKMIRVTDFNDPQNIANGIKDALAIDDPSVDAKVNENGTITLSSKTGSTSPKVELGTAESGLTLQIGDTSDDYNRLTVSVGDMHAKNLGIGDLDISTQEGGTAAIDKIKAAINSVSSTRGDLGAAQNRLEHTINNLSVMQENIQDAEASIRDVDVAKEMMSYTKNNILVQSAQAMLAQANQLPQGVLQLLG